LRTFLLLAALLVIAWAVLTDLPGEILRELRREPTVREDINPPPPREESPAPLVFAQATWPYETKLHPLVKNIPPAEENSFESVARYLVANEPDQLQRLKAIHDYLADRVAYDAESYLAGKSPPDDPAAVFSTRKSVCAGYAKLFNAMATTAGFKSRIVSGRARSIALTEADEAHAWNIVELDGRERLIDVTWDAGHLKDRAFVQKYSTDYFLAPPEIFAVSHFPDRPEDQLLATPLSRQDYLVQPLLAPRFYAYGLKLRTPLRSQIQAPPGDLFIELENPRGVWLMGSIGTADCSAKQTEVRCPVLPGTHRVMLFAGVERYGVYEHIGAFDVVR
jgi:transglutaminase/protease-like cytokinesis protein 3